MKSGDHIVSASSVFGATHSLFVNYFPKWNIETTYFDLNHPETINLIPIFEYISYNNIELYDFKKIDINDVDVTKDSDLERFVLTHVYYITQSK